MYGTPEQPTVDNARLQLVGKAKLVWSGDIPHNHSRWELITARANYQAQVWLQANQDHVHITSATDTST